MCPPIWILGGLAAGWLAASALAGAASQEAIMTMTLTSPAFGEGQPIPAQYTCEGDDLSPPLSWTEPPAGTRSLALINDDPDAPGQTWVHWLVYNLPPAVRALPEGVPAEGEQSDGTRQGQTDFGRVGYGGPCPPSGTHRYYFKLYALDVVLALRPGATKAQLERAMQGHVLAEAQLMGTYRRQGR
jgi:Raf kinase inhibitor-like YbhB/YbcL family protein